MEYQSLKAYDVVDGGIVIVYIDSKSLQPVTFCNKKFGANIICISLIILA